MAKALNSRFVETAPPGKYGDALTKGLQLVVAPTGARKWVLRFMSQGKAREMGLGSFPEVGLADAREKALSARRIVKDGKDPIADRKRDRGVPTFGELADAYLETHESGWRNDKHKAQWAMTLTVYAATLRSLPVDKVETADVLAVLKPIWLEKAPTAQRLRGRIERVLNAAKARGLRSGENPATWRGHLENLLPKQPKLPQPHHAAMPYDEVPAFLAKLRQRDAVAAKALEFAILTATRSGEVLGARWAEFDLDAGVWTIPATRTKAGREHRVPLSDAALRILAKLSSVRVSEFIFPGQRRNSPLSPPAMGVVLIRMGVSDAVTVHGFRSSFRDWAGNETHFPREIAEQALAHSIGNKAEAAYRRGDALEKRRAMMEGWAQWCEPKEENVVAFARTKR